MEIICSCIRIFMIVLSISSMIIFVVWCCHEPTAFIAGFLPVFIVIGLTIDLVSNTEF